MDAIQKAKSGHPGMPMGMAAAAYTLWTRHLRFDPAAPRWVNRDRFVLSGGHGCMLLYSLLHLTGYDLPLDEIKNFRQWGSKTPGHPEFGHTPGVEATTGPLGQGLANAVGMALAEAYLGGVLQPSRAHGHRPSCLRHRGGRMPAGRCCGRGLLAGGTSRAEQTDRPLRRQPHLHRRRHRAIVLRGCPEPLRRLRVVRAGGGRGRQRSGCDRSRDRRCEEGNLPAVADQNPDPHRVRQSEQTGYGRSARVPARRRRRSR